MRYFLYVGENCHDCLKVSKAIVDMGLDIPIRNIDKGDKPPFEIFIFPALLNREGDLKAYGLDILDFLQRPDAKAPKLSFFKRFKRLFSGH